MNDFRKPEWAGTGLIERDFEQFPVGYCPVAAPFDSSVIIPESEWRDRHDAMVAAGARYSDTTRSIPVLNQGSEGYCWAYSTVRCVQLLRFKQGLGTVRLSAHAVGCMVKNFRNEGGWNTQSLEFIARRGVPSVEFWPERSMNPRFNNPKTWENAAGFRITEWWDAPRDPEARRAAFISALLLGMPIASDYMDIRHSVCVHSILQLDPLVVEYDNSWGSAWGDNGRGTRRGRQAIPDGFSVPRVVVAS